MLRLNEASVQGHKAENTLPMFGWPSRVDVIVFQRSNYFRLPAFKGNANFSVPTCSSIVEYIFVSLEMCKKHERNE